MGVFRDFGKIGRSLAATASVRRLLSSSLIMFLATAAVKSDDQLITVEQCWSYGWVSPAVSRPAADGSNLYLAETDGRVSAISLATGERLWLTELGGTVASNIISAGDVVFVVVRDVKMRSHLRSLSRTSGIPVTDVEIASGRAALGISGGLLVVISEGSSVSGYRVGSVKPEWQSKYETVDLDTAVFATDRIIISTADKKIHIVSSADAREISVISTEQKVSSLAMIDDDILVADERGRLTRYDLDGPSVAWKLKNGARITYLHSSDSGIIAASQDNFVYLMSGYNGNIHWKRRLPGRISGMEISDDIGIVQTIGDSTASLVDLENGKAAGQFSVGADRAFVYPPIAAGGGVIFFANDRIVFTALGQCRQK